MTYKYNNTSVNINIMGAGAPVMLLHGWGCSNEIFRDIQQVLSQSYTTYNFDFPGFGASDEPDTVWGIEEYTRMVEQFVKDNDIEKPSLIGHSFGGRVSIVYASRNDVERVVLVDAAGIKPKRPLKYYWKVYTFKTLKWLCNTFLPKEKAQAIIDRRRRGAGSSDYSNASPMMRAILSKVVNEDLTHLLPKITAPTLLFWGDMDTATPLSDAKTMERLIPDAGLVVAHRTGHFSFLENAVLFTAVMKNFFKIK
ncbi:MAG: alpha/beta hydrolase [Alistipes sp.]|nr:alpha/beta hydrolase [Alistipes sp.]